MSPESKNPTLHNPVLHEAVFRLLEKEPRGRLLDVPSGPGYFAQRATKAGFDSMAGEIDTALHVLDGVVYEQIDMSRPFPLDAGAFQYVVSIEGIEHIENQFLFLRECRRVLGKGGKLFLTTPNASSFENRMQFLLTGFHEHPASPIRKDSPNILFEHINLIPFARLETFLRLSGFRILHVGTSRLQKGSLLLYPLLYPFVRFRMARSFRKYFKGKPDEAAYRALFQLHLSRSVLCGSDLVLVAGVDHE